MARVLLTGATGFLGRRVLAHLTASGHAVVTFGRHERSSDRSVTGDITDAAACLRAVAEADVIVHLAALTGRARAAQFAKINVDGTRALVEAASRAGVQRLLFCSTIAVTFADLDGYPYAQSKRLAENVVARSGLKFTTVRPTILGGPGSPVLSKLASLARLPIIPLFDGGRARVQPIHVDDAARAISALVGANRFDGEVLDLGGPQTATVCDLLDRLCFRQAARSGRYLTLPVRPLLPLLRLGEATLGAAWPLSVGQLATFRFDGLARTPQAAALWAGDMVPLDRMLDEAVAP